MFISSIKKTAFSISLSGLLFCSCGKQVNKEGSNNKETRTPALSTSTVELANDGSAPDRYEMQSIGDVYIPENLRLIAGGDYITKIYFQFGSDTEFECRYRLKTSDQYSLMYCYSGGTMNLQAGDKVPLFQGDVIKVERSGDWVQAELEIDWH